MVNYKLSIYFSTIVEFSTNKLIINWYKHYQFNASFIYTMITSGLIIPKNQRKNEYRNLIKGIGKKN
jgi:hypothetical protein